MQLSDLPPFGALTSPLCPPAPLRERRCDTSRLCRPQPPPTISGGSCGPVSAGRVRGFGPSIDRSRKQKKQGCVFVPRKLPYGTFRDHFKQPCSARPSHSDCSRHGAHSEPPATPCGRRGLGIRGVCDAGLRPCPLHSFYSVIRQRSDVRPCAELTRVRTWPRTPRTRAADRPKPPPKSTPKPSVSA